LRDGLQICRRELNSAESGDRQIKLTRPTFYCDSMRQENCRFVRHLPSSFRPLRDISTPENSLAPLA